MDLLETLLSDVVVTSTLEQAIAEFGDEFCSALLEPTCADDRFKLAVSTYAHATRMLADDIATAALGSACKDKCVACCSQLVPVALYEATLLYASLRDADTCTVLSEVASLMWPVLVESGFFNNAGARYNGGLFPQAVHDIWREHFTMCPFLVEDSCSVYNARPVRCQAYFAPKGSAHFCKDGGSPPARLVLLEDAAQAVQAAAARCFEKRVLQVPLPLKPLPMPLAIACASVLWNYGPEALIERLS
jgi:Fe-S-cluster containining protein